MLVRLIFIRHPGDNEEKLTTSWRGEIVIWSFRKNETTTEVYYVGSRAKAPH